MTRIPDPKLRPFYRQRFWSSSAPGPSPPRLRIYALKCATHWHMHEFVRGRAEQPRAPAGEYLLQSCSAKLLFHLLPLQLSVPVLFPRHLPQMRTGATTAAISAWASRPSLLSPAMAMVMAIPPITTTTMLTRTADTAGWPVKKWNKAHTRRIDRLTRSGGSAIEQLA